jgi:1-acyl-sn-glycerol-3-phosphate acyltransferase
MLAAARELVKEDRPLAIFPEGTRVPTARGPRCNRALPGFTS